MILREDNLIDALERRFPELRRHINDEIVFFEGDDPGSHIVYGDVLVPWIEQLLSSQEDSDRIAEVFDFLETLATSPDTEVQAVLGATVCEGFLSVPGLLEQARKWMKPETLRFSHQIEDYWQNRSD